MTRQRGLSLAPSRGAKRESPFQTGRRAVTAHKPAGPLPGSLTLWKCFGRRTQVFPTFYRIVPRSTFSPGEKCGTLSSLSFGKKGGNFLSVRPPRSVGKSAYLSYLLALLLFGSNGTVSSAIGLPSYQIVLLLLSHWQSFSLGHLPGHPPAADLGAAQGTWPVFGGLWRGHGVRLDFPV